MENHEALFIQDFSIRTATMIRRGAEMIAITNPQYGEYCGLIKSGCTSEQAIEVMNVKWQIDAELATRKRQRDLIERLTYD